MMHGGQAEAGELLGDVGDPRLRAGILLGLAVLREGRPLSKARLRSVGDPSVEVAIGIMVERAAERLRRVLGNAGKLERLAVGEHRVPAAVDNRHRMNVGHAIEIGDG